MSDNMYYANKLDSLKDIFGSDKVFLEKQFLVVDGRVYPVIDDIIVILNYDQYPTALKKRLKPACGDVAARVTDFAEDIQFTFGEEWQRFPKILPEHEYEFRQYFDLVNISDLKDSRVCDLGCGIGRWSYFLRDKCRELVLVDFSEAIFVARKNLIEADNVIFFMGDLKDLPFRDSFADFLFCLGVLHHLPTNALDEVRGLKRYAPVLLIYLYYALDNRAFYFRILLAFATLLRKMMSKTRNPSLRSLLTLAATGLYVPFISLGRILKPLGISKYIPLYEGYGGKSLERIRQDVYDRFFTRIEQRFSRKQILELGDTFRKVVVSDQLPYWHFVCER